MRLFFTVRFRLMNLADPLPNKAPRVSIVVATYNAAKTLRRCLTSIATQTFAEWELIVVDGGSADATVDIIRDHVNQIAYWHSHPDRGIYDAWNQALIKTRGEYVAFLGADDTWHATDTLQRIFESIAINKYDLVTSRGVLRDSEGRPAGEVGGPWNYKTMPRRMDIIHPGLLHRRTLFETYGVFDSSLKIVGDLDFLLRLPSSIRTLYIPQLTVDVQIDGISRRQFWCRIRERSQVHARCARVGPARASLYWLDKAWRMPIARLLGLPH